MKVFPFLSKFVMIASALMLVGAIFAAPADASLTMSSAVIADFEGGLEIVQVSGRFYAPIIR